VHITITWLWLTRYRFYMSNVWEGIQTSWLKWLKSVPCSAAHTSIPFSLLREYPPGLALSLKMQCLFNSYKFSTWKSIPKFITQNFIFENSLCDILLHVVGSRWYKEVNDMNECPQNEWPNKFLFIKICNLCEKKSP